MINEHAKLQEFVETRSFLYYFCIAKISLDDGVMIISCLKNGDNLVFI